MIIEIPNMLTALLVGGIPIAQQLYRLKSCIKVCMYVCMYVCICTYVRMYLHMYVCNYVCM